MSNTLMGTASLAVILGLCTTTAAGQEVYKSTNSRGQVSYGDQPSVTAAKVEEVKLQTGPTPEEVRQAQRAGERIEQSADAMQAVRVAKEQARTA